MLQTEEKKKGKFNWMFGCLIIALVLSIGIGASMFIFLRVPDNSKEARKVIEDRLNKINSGLAISPEKNGWVDYKKGLTAMWETKMPSDTEEPVIDRIKLEGANEDILAYVRLLKEKNEETLKDFKKGYEKPDFQVKYKYEDGLDYSGVDYLKIRKAVRLLILMGEYAALNGGYDETVNYYLQAHRLGEGVGNNGFMMPGMISIAMEKQTSEAMLKLFRDYELNPDQYQAVIDKYQELEDKRFKFPELIKSEMVLVHNTMNNLRSGKYNTQQNKEQLALIRPFIGREEKILENFNLKWLKEVEGPYHDVSGFKYDFPIFATLSKILAPNYNEAYRNYYLSRTVNRGVIVTAALKKYFAEKGKYPETLEELTPEYLKEIPKDPMARDEKFRYVLKDGKPLLYSVSKDQKDDGGGVHSPDLFNKGDYVFLGEAVIEYEKNKDSEKEEDSKKSAKTVREKTKELKKLEKETPEPETSKPEKKEPVKLEKFR